MTAAELLADFQFRRETDTLGTLVPFRLKAQMSKHHVTIKALAVKMSITMKRVRAVRSLDRLPYLDALSYQEAVESLTKRKAD